MNDKVHTQQAVQLLMQAHAKLALIEDPAVAGSFRALGSIIDELGVARSVGPSGYEPKPAYEKCPNCEHYRTRG
jgi:hypothetical protein